MTDGRPARAPRSLPARAVLALAAVFLAAHLASLPPSLEDLDSVNFAMGVRDFDVAQHQPHPPGYPVFIAAGKLATSAFRATGAAAPETYGLAIWSAIGGAALVLLAFAFFRVLEPGGDWHAALAAALLAASPLFWFTSLRPLSDVAGLSAAFASLAAVAGAIAPGGGGWTPRRARLLALGAFAAGLAIGVRSQTAVMTLPMLTLALILPGTGTPHRARITALIAAAAGVAAWGIPLIVASGGPSAYLLALHSQAGEDFSGVVMLWTHRTVRVAAFAILHTFVLPWDSPALAGVVLALAACGVFVVLWRAPRALLILAIVFGPYAIFHVLFQETVTVRYALPLVVPVAYLAAAVLARASAAAGAIAATALIALCLFQAVPAGAAFGAVPAPVFSLLAEMRLLQERGAQPVVGMHRRISSESRRARQWAGPLPGALLASPRDYEWLELTRRWREGFDGEAWFLADPRRTDLALIDAEHRRTREYRWPFDQAVYVGGARPGEIDWHVYHQPGWFLEQGWALTPEAAGITERDGGGPHVRPSIGWIRRRTGAAVLMIGGRHLGGPSEPPVRIVASIDDRPVATIETGPGYFLRFVTVSEGQLAGTGYAALTVRADSVSGAPVPRVAIEQFNLQSSGVVQFGYGDGWFEPELNPQTARSWRWAGESASLRLSDAGSDVAVRIRGENPLRYFEDPPVVRLTAGDRTLAEVRPDRDFTIEAVVPAAALANAGNTVVLRSSAAFVAGEREGTGDRRRLALRIYSVDIRPR